MRDYSAEEIDYFLSRVDAYLTEEVSLILIGGTAAMLAYKISQATSDIDKWNQIDRVKKAYELAKEETGFDIPLSQTGVADPPHGFEDRGKCEDLVSRYVGEMASAVVPKRKRDLNFLAMIERCFPGADLERIESNIR